LSEEILQILLLYSYHTSAWNKVWVSRLTLIESLYCGWWTWLESCRVNENRDRSVAVQKRQTITAVDYIALNHLGKHKRKMAIQGIN